MKGKVVVTGGAGFIGSNLAKKLAEEGYQVVVIDDFSTGSSENIASFPREIQLVRGSILSSGLLNEIFDDADYVLHQAAIPSVERSVRNPVGTSDVNVIGSVNVLTAAKDRRVKKVVLASSSSVYGDTPTLPKKEDMRPRPKSPYAVSKLAVEEFARVFYEIFGLRTACLRYFNVYGPHQDPASEYAAVIPRFITAALDGCPMIINGDGKQTRDFTFVEDVVQANILAMLSPSTGVFNIAKGERTSINDLAGMIMEISGKETNIKHSEPRAGDVKDSLADILLAKEGFGYDPKFSLKEGLEETVKWFRSC